MTASSWSEEDRRGLAMHVHAEPPADPSYKSCFWALVRDARQVAKRDLDSGDPLYTEEARGEDASIWGASLLYMVLVDQIGTAFELDSQPATSQAFRSALEIFGQRVVALSLGEIDALYALRCSFAHDYSLVNNHASNPSLRHLFVVIWSPGRPLVALPTPPWDGNTANPLPPERTFVNLKALEELVEGMVAVIQTDAKDGALRLAGGMPMKEFTERYSFRITVV
jgi:hypothetical protein